MHAINLARQFSATRSERPSAVRQRRLRPLFGSTGLDGRPAADRRARPSSSAALDLPKPAARRAFDSNRLDTGFRGRNRLRNAGDAHALRPARHARCARGHRQPQRPTANEPARRLGSRPDMLTEQSAARLHAGRSAGGARAHARRACRRGHRPRPEHPVRARIRHAPHGDPARRDRWPRNFARSIASPRSRSRPTRRHCADWSETAVASLPAGSTARVELAAGVPAQYRITIEWPVAGFGMQRLVLPVTT